MIQPDDWGKSEMMFKTDALLQSGNKKEKLVCSHAGW